MGKLLSFFKSKSHLFFYEVKCASIALEIFVTRACINIRLELLYQGINSENEYLQSLQSEDEKWKMLIGEKK